MYKLMIAEFLKKNWIEHYEIKGNKIRFARSYVAEFIEYLEQNNYIYNATYRFGEWSEVEIIGYKVFAPITLLDN